MINGNDVMKTFFLDAIYDESISRTTYYYPFILHDFFQTKEIDANVMEPDSENDQYYIDDKILLNDISLIYGRLNVWIYYIFRNKKINSKLIKSYYKHFLTPYLYIDKRVQRKFVNDRITLDDLLGVFGAAFIKFTSSDYFKKDINFLTNKLFSKKFIWEDVHDGLTLRELLTDSIYPKLKSVFGESLYNDNIHSKWSNLRRQMVFDKNDIFRILIGEMIKIVYIINFRTLIIEMLSNTHKYKELRPFIDSNHTVFTSKLRVLYGNSHVMDDTVEKCRKTIDTLINVPEEDTLKKFGEIITKYCEDNKPIFHYKDSSGLLFSKSFEKLSTYKNSENVQDINEYRENVISSINELYDYFINESYNENEKLSNCFNFDISDIIEELFNSKVSSVCYFDPDLYIKSRRV